MSEKTSKPPVAEWMREAAQGIANYDGVIYDRYLIPSTARDAIPAFAESIARKHAEGCDGRPRSESLCPMHLKGKRPLPIDTGVCTYCRLNAAEDLKQRVKELIEALQVFLRDDIKAKPQLPGLPDNFAFNKAMVRLESVIEKVKELL